MTYDVARTMSYVYILYIARTTLYMLCLTRCSTLHVLCRTCMTYNIVHDVQHCRWQESRHHYPAMAAQEDSLLSPITAAADCSESTTLLWHIFLHFFLHILHIHYIILHIILFFVFILSAYCLHNVCIFCIFCILFNIFLDIFTYLSAYCFAYYVAYFLFATYFLYFFINIFCISEILVAYLTYCFPTKPQIP